MVEITGSLIPNFDVDVAVLRAGMDPEPTRGLMRSPTELMEGEPICSNVCVCECERQTVCVRGCECLCAWMGRMGNSNLEWRGWRGWRKGRLEAGEEIEVRQEGGSKKGLESKETLVGKGK